MHFCTQVFFQFNGGIVTTWGYVRIVGDFTQLYMHIYRYSDFCIQKNIVTKRNLHLESETSGSSISNSYSEKTEGRRQFTGLGFGRMDQAKHQCYRIPHNSNTLFYGHPWSKIRRKFIFNEQVIQWKFKHCLHYYCRLVKTCRYCYKYVMK